MENRKNAMRDHTPQFAASCLALYRSYEILNRVCWQGALPASMLALSFRLSPCTGAYAQDAPDGYRIVFNAALCRLMDDAAFLEIMVHEMIHIRQYSLGRRGGHGRDFQDELRRIGLIQGQVILPASPFGYVIFMHGIKQLHPAEAARHLAALRASRKAYSDYFRTRARCAG